MPRFSVPPAALAAGVADLDQGIRDIGAQLDDLRAHLAPVRRTWDGSASTSWEHYQQLWDTAAADLTASLGTLHRIASTAHANYTAAEAANGRIWTA